MSSLKHIIAGHAGVSLLSTTAIWDQDVTTITPAQMVAFVGKMKFSGHRDEAESALEIAIRLVNDHVTQRQLAPPAMLDYVRPNYIFLTKGELRRALAFMRPVQACAVVFALETGLLSQEVASLTHATLHEMRLRRQLSELALACVTRVPRSVQSPYVFWRAIEIAGRATTASVPIADLDEVVFDAFGLVWGELEQAYANLVPVDEDADREDFASFFDL